jgi:hypothetical protein
MKRALLFVGAGLVFCLMFFVPTTRSDPPPDDSEFTYARIRYHLTPEGYWVRETPWHHDFPFSDQIFPEMFGEVTNTKTNENSHQIVDIDSPDLFKYPFAYICEVGYIDLQPRDVVNLREYLDRGGFLLVDDFRTAAYSPQGGLDGEDDIAHFRQEVRKMYPDAEFVPLDVSDPIFNTFYKIESLQELQAPYFFPGQHPPRFMGLRDKHGRLMMILDDNNDISEYWEWVERGEKSMHDAATSFHFGINYALYAMTH